MSSISIVIPIYNVRPFIERCVSSVLEQTYSDFEAVFVDDGSTDGSISVVRRFARNDSRVVILSHEKNKGAAAARNTGIASVKSDRITFVDGDDFIAPNLLEILVRGSDGGRFDIVETGCEAIDDNDNLIWRYEPEPGQIDDLSRNPDAILNVQEWGVTQKLWRTSLFHGEIKFPDRAYWEDISVVPSLVAEARNLVKIPFVGYSYLQRSNSTSNRKSVKHVLDLFHAFERYRQYLLKRGVFESYRPTFLQVVHKTTDYQIGQFKLNWSGSDGSANANALVELCKVLRAEYLAGKAVIGRLTESQFESLIERSALDKTNNVELASEYLSLIEASSELNGGSGK